MFKICVGGYILIIVVIISESKTNDPGSRDREDLHHGRNFPVKYLYSDVNPEPDDINHYLRALIRVKSFYMYRFDGLNYTTVNEALGFFYTKSILKRTLRDYTAIFNDKQYRVMKNLIIWADEQLRHYIDYNMSYGWSNPEFRMSSMFRDDEPLLHSMGDFTQNRLIPWILDGEKINDYEEHLDTLRLSKEDYVRLLQDRDVFHMHQKIANECIFNVAHNPVPVRITQLTPCRASKTCKKSLKSTPSFGIGHIHKILYIIFNRNVKRCYLLSEKKDEQLMEKACAAMYREAVYAARKGFISRDHFMQHVTLCAMGGFEEFHRRSWFLKIASWVDIEGCVAENENYIRNRTRIRNELKNEEDRKKLVFESKKLIADECHRTLMGLGSVALSHAVRYSAYYLMHHTQGEDTDGTLTLKDRVHSEL